MIRLIKRSTPTTTDIGRFGERAAARLLRRKGYRILAKNRHEGRNELDLVAENRETIVFVEVKTRTADRQYKTDYGTPSDAVTASKRKRTIAAAKAYLYKNPSRKAPRFDVIEVYLGNTERKRPSILGIEHLEDAFRD